MVKKLQGETFLLSANELRSGKVVFLHQKAGQALLVRLLK